jgi:hypothetical protein
MTSIGSAAMTAAVDGDEAPQPFTIFHSFPKLPKEIRLMIWELQLPGPRIVHLELKQFKVAKSSWLLEYEMLYGRRYYSGGMEHDYKDYTWPNYPPEFGRGGKKIERWKQSCQWISSHRAPTILFVNRESHHVGKTVYTQVSCFHAGASFLRLQC